MPILLAESDINFDASSWKLVNSATFKDTRAATTAISTLLTSSIVSTPGSITIDGILLEVASRSSNTAGTFTLQLYNNTTATIEKTVVINTLDIPATTTNLIAWLYFKFDSPMTTTAGNTYVIRMVSSTSANQVTVYRSATANDFTFNYVLSSTQAPVSGDTLFVSGPFTGSTTPPFINVTYAQTATTDSYNLLYVGSYGGMTLENQPNKNYYLSMLSRPTAGYSIEVTGNGYLRFGTSGSTLDSSSNFILSLRSNLANGNGILLVGNGSEFSSYGKPINRSARLTANVSANTTNQVTTNIVTNWTSSTTGDIVVIGSTTRGTSAIESRFVTGSTGNTVAFSGNVTTSKSGTTGIQAPLVYIGGNIIFSATNTTNTFNIRQLYGSKLYLKDVTMYFMGSATGSLRGLMPEGLVGSECIIDNCAFWNNNASAQILPVTTTNNFIIRDCVGAIGIVIPTITSTNTQVVSGCTFVGGTNQTISSSNTSINTLFYNNVFNGNNGTNGIFTYSPIFPFTANTTYFYNNEFSCSPGNALTYGGTYAIISGITIWNCNASGLLLSTAGTSMNNASNLNIYGSTTANLALTGVGMYGYKFTDCNFGAESVGASNVTNVLFTTPVMYPNSNSQTSLHFDNCTFGSTILGATTADVVTTTSPFLPNTLFDNCTFRSTNRYNVTTTNLFFGTKIRFQKINGNINDHRTYFRNGYVQSDTTIVDSSPVSVRCVPSSATVDLISPLFKVNVLSGQSVNISVKVRKSVVGDGAVYNGSQPTLRILFRDDIGFSGLTYNRFLFEEFATILTATDAANGGWETLTWTSPIAQSNSAIDFYVFCNGTTGWVNWDTIRVF